MKSFLLDDVLPKAILLFAILALLYVVVAHGADAPKPTSIAAADREKVKDLRIQAYESLTKILDAERRKEAAAKIQAEATLDADKAQRQLDEINARITKLTEDIRKGAGASEDKWCITQDYQWVAKPEGKPCPGL